MQITGASIFLFLVIFCIGAAVGGVIERALKSRSLPPAPSPRSKNDTLAKAGDVEILRAWRTHDNKVWLGMDGTRLNNKAELQPTQYQRLLNLVLDLRPWLETTRPAGALTEPAQEPLHNVMPVPAVALPPVKAEKDVAPIAEKAAPAPVLDSMIQQIDKVLQALLETSPLKDRGIQLVEGPGGSVIVKDGIKSYEGIDAIPDPEVKKLIRQAVTDWEKSAK